MNLTNKLRLPEPIVRAIANDSYTKGDADISVTELLNPPQLRALRIANADLITEDASDRIWSLLGQSVHTIIERAGSADNELSEVTLTTTYEGWKIKGTFDHVSLADAALSDFKVTSAWKVRNGGVPFEWEAQTNIYRRMLQREKNLTINSIAIFAILRDWSKPEAARNPDYPQAQAVRLDVPLWSADKTDAFITERVLLHQAILPAPCSESDIWATPTRYAVVKKGQTRATKLFDHLVDAVDLAESIPGATIMQRPGVARRCQDYCPVSQFCPQWAADPRRPAPSEGLFNV